MVYGCINLFSFTLKLQFRLVQHKLDLLLKKFFLDISSHIISFLLAQMFVQLCDEFFLVK